MTSGRPFDTVLFDLDGVLTDTAAVHSAAWKETFDELLRAVSRRSGAAFRPFTEEDYLRWVDGKPRYEGVAAFLAARGIELPRGQPTDPPGRETVCGLGNDKNERFGRVLERDGVAVYPSSVELLDELRRSGVRVGVVTSSRNARAVLAAAGLLERAGTLLDGVEAERRGLSGKPSPETFLALCADLGTPPDRAVVIEDALAGVRAGAAGGFGLVVGVARSVDPAELLAAGADLAVRDLEELSLARLDEWFAGGLERALWSVRFGFEPAAERTREVLCTVGNGYFATRGAAEESRAGALHYPGTYLAGVYDRQASRVAGRRLEHDDLVNCPNWLPVRFRIGRDGWLDLERAAAEGLGRRLDLERGVLHRELVLRDRRGRRTALRSARLASMAEPHVAALRYRLEPLGYGGRVRLRSALDGAVANSGVERYRALASRHLEVLERGGEGGAVHLLARTLQSGIEIALAAVHRATLDGEPVTREVHAGRTRRAAHAEIALDLEPGSALEVEKLVAICTSRDADPRPPLERAREIASRLASFAAVEDASAAAWARLWDEADLRIEGDRRAQTLSRFNAFHLFAAAGPHHPGLDAGVAARGLHGEAYRGHVFWDELFILPFFNLHLPGTSRSALLYRHRRLDPARRAARRAGARGALFPWQSAGDGGEETPSHHLNPRSGAWSEDRSRLQRHVTLAIAYNVWRYFAATGDLAFLAAEGGELLVEIARFWASAARRDPASGRYSIAGVMGPDEFHEGYPGAPEAGLRDNAYTNLMASWLLRKVPAVLSEIPAEDLARLRDGLGLEPGEPASWLEVGRKLRLPVSADGVFEQFDGFFALEELDWEALRRRHGRIGRLDRLLEAEGDTPDRYQAIKQADALMPFFALPPEEVEALVRELAGPARRSERPPASGSGVREAPTPPADRSFDALLAANFDFYYPRTSHGSTLSALVHGVLAHRLGRHDLAARLFQETLEADFADVQGGTTGEGIHAGALAGGLLWVLEVYAGIDNRSPELRIDPRLPSGWRRLACRFHHHGARYALTVARDSARIEMLSGPGPASLTLAGKPILLEPGQTEEIGLGADC